MKMRMLITDDDPCLQALYRNLFGKYESLEIDYAESAEASKAFLESGHYDLALLDISLGDPCVDGISLLRMIKATSPDTDVVMMSTGDSGDTVNLCLRQGARQFTSKNRDFAFHLRTQVEAFLDERRPVLAAC